MSRPLRIEYPDAWYHVMNRGRRGVEVFTGPKDYRQFIEIINETARIWKLRIAAYCLMPNHYHLLVQTPNGNLSRCLRHIDGVYTQRFNRAHGTDGPLFRGRYKSILVEADSYLLPLVRYIHRNPMRTGLAKTMAGYAWSSHRTYLSSTEIGSWFYKDFILSMFSRKKQERLRAYRRFVSLEDEEEIIEILGRKKWPAVLGSRDFIYRIKERFYSGKIGDEVSRSKGLAPKLKQIQKAVEKFYGISKKELMSSRRGVFNEPRNMAIYLTRQLRGDSLRQIGIDFRLNNYSSVSSAIERTKRRIAENRKLRAKLKKFLSQLSKSQKQT
ncbi:MAG: transposase [Deltaproteobacteria bacterium]|nr:transposase [Deltaproteobacteria bacterium]